MALHIKMSQSAVPLVAEKVSSCRFRRKCSSLRSWCRQWLKC